MIFCLFKIALHSTSTTVWMKFTFYILHFFYYISFVALIDDLWGTKTESIKQKGKWKLRKWWRKSRDRFLFYTFFFVLSFTRFTLLDLAEESDLQWVASYFQLEENEEIKSKSLFSQGFEFLIPFESCNLMRSINRLDRMFSTKK